MSPLDSGELLPSRVDSRKFQQPHQKKKEERKKEKNTFHSRDYYSNRDFYENKSP
jgi:hypothetical protein